MTRRSRSAARATCVGGLMLFLLPACGGGSAPNQPAAAEQSAVQPAKDPLAAWFRRTSSFTK